MPDGAYSLRSTLVDNLTRFQRPDVPVTVALRNTAAVVLPLAAGFASGHAMAGVGVSAGALEVMFADQPGPYVQRVQVIALVTLAATLSGLTGFLVGAHPWLDVAALALWGFLGGLAVLYGPNMARVGMTSMILLAVATSTPMRLHDALAASGLILAGGALQALFSIAAWPLQRYRPERLALASVYRDLARQARHQPGIDDAPPASDTLTGLQQTLLGRPHARGRAMEAFHTLLELSERMRLEWMALAQDAVPQPALVAFRVRAAHVLDAIADALEHASHPAAAQWALQALEDMLAETPSTAWSALTRRRLQALTGQLAAAVRNANWAGGDGEIRARKADTSLPRALRNAAPWAALRANLTLRSSAFRHGLRCAVVLALALIVAHAIGLARAYWVPMTAAIVLRPDFGATVRVGYLRVIGTLLGLGLTTVLLHFTPDSIWAHLAVMTLLCFAFRYLANAHYGVAVVALTGTVVILLAFAGVDAGRSVDERVVNTALGSAMALIAYLVWPTWEGDRARSALADMLAAYAHYLACLANGSDDVTLRDARTAARAGRSNAQASIGRLRSEPASTRAQLRLATTVFAAGNRLVRTAMALEAELDEDGKLPAAATLASFMRACDAALAHCVAGLRHDEATTTHLPPLRSLQQQLAADLNAAPDAESAASLIALTDRLTDNIDTLAHALDSRPANASVAQATVAG
ncbi:MAG TPA: FUSC family protein [Rhodanobacteraceae bacterium]